MCLGLKSNFRKEQCVTWDKLVCTCFHLFMSVCSFPSKNFKNKFYSLTLFILKCFCYIIGFNIQGISCIIYYDMYYFIMIFYCDMFIWCFLKYSPVMVAMSRGGDAWAFFCNTFNTCFEIIVTNHYFIVCLFCFINNKSRMFYITFYFMFFKVYIIIIFLPIGVLCTTNCCPAWRYLF